MKRVDVLLVERGLCRSREEAQARILAGEVWWNEVRLEKAGQAIHESTPLEIRSRRPAFVSRAGLKLEHALKQFNVDVRARVCLDIGASTGGFTHCLLERGAAHVFAVDVGYGQIDQSLREERVSVLEKTNARYLTLEQLLERNASAERISLIVIDVSFISLTKIIPNTVSLLRSASDWVVLFKPQFEVGREFVGKGGLVKSEEAVRHAINNFHDFMKSHKLFLKHGPEVSPVPGKKSGNLEYLIHYQNHVS